MKATKKIIGKYFRLIDFHVYDNMEDEVSETESTNSDSTVSQFTIQMFGLNESGDTCSIVIHDYEPFFYIKVGDNWNQLIADQLLDEIKKKIWKHASSVLSIQIVDYHKLYGFSGGKKSRFVKVTFANMVAFNKVKGLWYKYDEESGQRQSKPYIFQKVKLELYESNIPPLLRYFHIQNISPSGWVCVYTPKCIIPNPKMTTCKFEYICSQKHVKPSQEKETRVPYKICSFDIEASSSHGDFPLPKKTYKRLATNIVDAFERHLSELTSIVSRKRFISKAIYTAFDYDNMDDIDLIYTVEKKPKKDEIKLLIDVLFESKIDINSAIEKEESTIEYLFEKMKEQNLSIVLENDEDEMEEDAEEYEPIDQKKEMKSKNKKMSKKSTPDTYIYDLLSSNDFKYDEKITRLNILLTKHFPKVEGD